MLTPKVLQLMFFLNLNHQSTQRRTGKPKDNNKQKKGLIQATFQFNFTDILFYNLAHIRAVSKRKTRDT